MNKKAVIACIITFLNLYLVWYYSSTNKDLLSKNIQSPTNRPQFRNRCENTTKEASRDFYSKERLPTLVIYVYSETSALKKSNFEFFLKHGLCEQCHNVDYAIVINGEKLTVDIPYHKNIYILQRENECGDFGAWEHLFTEMDQKKLKKYKRFMFINDTVKGPFIDPNYLILFSHDFHFTDLFSALLTEETRLVGSYIHCGNLDPDAVVGFSHVQTMSFMMDDVALEISRPIIKCYANHSDTIWNGEIGLSKNLIQQNINIAAMMYAYRGVDFRCNDPLRYVCNDLNYAVFQHKYFGISVSPMEVVFIKDTVQPNQVMLDLYSEWTSNFGNLV